MVTFLLILVGLIAFNFILLKFSIQSVDADKSKAKRIKSTTTKDTINKTKTAEIAKAA
ncbi:hypothetical protein [uncultured Aquimarina sp.]|uniref:hypothetical protein n=1 Tax=uncultured Aquimarina sp. TaxID=575652 RepID=UPI00263967A4|nr:hypothetical protein [uncultured Aquimarina sp.]